MIKWISIIAAVAILAIVVYAIVKKPKESPLAKQVAEAKNETEVLTGKETNGQASPPPRYNPNYEA